MNRFSSMYGVDDKVVGDDDDDDDDDDLTYSPNDPNTWNDTAGSSLKHHQGETDIISMIRNLQYENEKRQKENEELRHIIQNNRNTRMNQDPFRQAIVLRKSNILSNFDASAIMEESSSSSDKRGLAQISNDTYTLMMRWSPSHRAWWLGLVVFSIEATLLAIGLTMQIRSSGNGTPVDVPFKADRVVAIGQVLAMIISLIKATDVTIAIRDLTMIRVSNYNVWKDLLLSEGEELLTESEKNKFWWKRVFFPRILQFLVGTCQLVISYVIILQSDNVIELFGSFVAMYLITEIDEDLFEMAMKGYLGLTLQTETAEASFLMMEDSHIHIHCCKKVSGRVLFLFVVFLTMIGGFVPYTISLRSGNYFSKKYPNCKLKRTEIDRISDGICDNRWPMNTYQCEYDGGDCIAFNAAFPNCLAPDTTRIGDGVCDELYNTKDCKYDGGDCCPIDQDDKYLGDGICHGGWYNTFECRFDNGDCEQLKLEFPQCPEIKENIYSDEWNKVPIVLGDKKCDFIHELNVESCGFEYGDCSECEVDDRDKLGDGKCDGGMYMTEMCGSDYGDCTDFVSRYPGCVIDYPKLIGDGWCDGGKYMTEECKYDGGDCAECMISDPYTINDGVCNEENLIDECGWDGGDCGIFCINRVAKSYSDHLSIAETYGGSLASIHCQEQLDAALKLDGIKFWIGLNDLSTEGKFVWTDESAVDFELWDPGQPDNWDNNEHCVEINFNLRFNDQSCLDKKIGLYKLDRRHADLVECIPVPICKSTAPPTAEPTQTQTFSCDVNTSAVKLTWQTDYYSYYDNEFKIISTATDVVEVSQDLGSLNPSNIYKFDYCLPISNCYELQIIDAYGDGILEGAITFEVDGVEVLNIAPNEEDSWKEKTVKFGDCSFFNITGS